MNDFEKLVQIFEGFPGVGARQARRFAFHVLTMRKADALELAKHIESLEGTLTTCLLCYRYFAPSQPSITECEICSDAGRDRTRIMVVERDTDVRSVERSGMYDGLYFVFGGTIPLLESKESHRVRGSALKERVDDQNLNEIILAFSVNPDGENTVRYIQSLLKDSIENRGIIISILGRGLSTGSELEYADPETIKNALKNRTKAD